MIIENKDVIDRYRGARVCGLCRHPTLNTDPHHVRTRGNSGSDVDMNIVAICRKCHNGVATTKEGELACREIIAKRLGCTAQDVWDANNFIAERLDKDDSEVRLAERIMTAVGDGTLTAVAARMVEDALIASGRLTLEK